jgi:GntR family transcriptional repressor for pyruvate dehydrogenase complex
MTGISENKESIFMVLKRQRLSDEIYNQLKEAVFSGHYKPGERLPNEKSLCQAFGVGRAVIREALRSLECSGFINVRRGSAGGAFVKLVDHMTLANTLEGILRLNSVSLQELTVARLSIEMAVFPIVLQNITDSDLERLEASIEEAREALARREREPKNGIFHLVLASISQNQLLISIIESLLELQKKFVHRYAVSFERKKRFIDEHERVLALLRAKKYKQAERVFGEHIRDSICLFISPPTR